MLCNWFSIFGTLFILLAPIPVFSENSGPNLSQGDEDRKEKYEKARDDTRDTNNNKLQPNMMKHIGNALQHFQQAQEARSEKNYGRAQQEDQMGMMEQMKAQQLNKQIQSNEKTAQQNDANSKMLKDPTNAKLQIPKAQDTPVISLRDPSMSTPTHPSPEPARSTSPIPKEELATLSAVSYIPAAVKPPEPAEKSSDALRAKFGYDEKTPVSAESGYGGRRQGSIM